MLGISDGCYLIAGVQEMEEFFGKNIILASRNGDQPKGNQAPVSAL